ncbi:hypothetical protein [Marivirga harenae]|uniref:hypothetical protein n=1 Tax=Marivirga harenae TaxID=2010992 RepID=UPI0026DEA2AF|nr:hypothetical protein [Marivirga harenae]WKV11671.1 hypothetical protein Q3Y49_15820 [Marivirga harenae]|tara:strand:- start:177858 stop:178301 length:444 start_codon:yes stop_codon:yes gene_type:complete
MKYIFTFSILVLVSIACSDFEQLNEDLCIPVVCGEIHNSDANLALFNDSGVDFDTFYYDIGGYQDSVGFFPLQQYTCWINIDTISTEYILAQGISDNIVYQSDTLWMDANAQTFAQGVFVLEIFMIDSDNKLEFQFVEDYTGECKDI